MAALDVTEAPARLGRSAVGEGLLAGLDEWMAHVPAAGRVKLLAAADAADQDPWRRSLREALVAQDRQKKRALAEQPDALEQPPALLVVLAKSLHHEGST